MLETADSNRKGARSRASGPQVAGGVLLVAFNLLFLALLILLASGVRLVADDFSLLGRANLEGGAWAGSSWFWYHWSGRWLAQTAASYIAVAVQADGNLFAYSLITYAALIASLWSLLRALLRRLSLPAPSLFVEANIAVAITALIFFATLDCGEVWFWLCGSLCYLWPFSFVFLAGAALLQPANRRGAGLLAGLLVALLSGCNESVAALTLVALAAGMAFLWLRERRRALNDVLFQRLACAFVFCLVSLLLESRAPGVHLRMAREHGGNLFKAVKFAAHVTPKAFLLYAQQRGWRMLFAAPIGAVFGRLCIPQDRRIEPRKMRLAFAATACIVVAGTYLSILLPAIGTGGLAPLRAWTQISVLLVGALIFLGALVSLPAKFNKIADAVAPVAIAGACVLTIFGLRRQVPITREYARRYDARYQAALRARDAGRRADMIVAPLGFRKEVAWIDVADPISAFRDNKWNVRFRRGLKLNFDTLLAQDNSDGKEDPSKTPAEKMTPDLP